VAPNWPTAAGLAESRRTAARVSRGAISFSSSSHFPLRLYSKFMKPVMLPPGRAKVSTKPAPTGSETSTNTIGRVRVACRNAATLSVPLANMRSGNQRDQFRRVSAIAIDIVLAPAGVGPDVAAAAPSQLLQGLLECRQLDLAAWIVRGPVHEHTEPPHALGLLRARRERPRCRCAAEQRDEIVLPQGWHGLGN